MRKLFVSVVILFTTITILAQVQKGIPQIPVYADLENKESFSMIMIPDPQSQTKFASNQPLFELMTAWIAQNIDRLNIKAALFTGDMVEQNNLLRGGGEPYIHNGDQTSRQQWEAVSRALARLDNKLPYIVSQGNHDVGYISAESRFSMMPQYIYPERNDKIMEHLVSTGANYENIHTLENAAYEFHNNIWGSLLIIAFEFAPRDEVLNWARELIESEKYKNHKVIILIHSFLDTNGDRFINEDHYKLTPRNWPQAVWEKLVYPSKNICLVLCGHAGTPTKIDSRNISNINDIDYSTSSSYRIDKAADGRNIPQMMFNAQCADGEWFGNGGDCWLRILEFMPDGKTIRIRTFSPLFALSKITAKYSWRTNNYDQFDIKIE